MKKERKGAGAALAPERESGPEFSSGSSMFEEMPERQGGNLKMGRQEKSTAVSGAGEHEMPLSFERETEKSGSGESPREFTEVLRVLRQPIDPHLIKTREGWTDREGNTHRIEYVEWHTVADILDRVAPAWSHSVRNLVQVGDMLAVTAAITIDGVTREGIGTGWASSEMGIKKAEHDALKRAAIKFGIARDLYQRETEVAEKVGPERPVEPAPPAEIPRDPLAKSMPDKSMSDMVTPRQLGMIRALGREIGVDVDEECQAQLNCRTEELSKRAASNFIDHLKGLLQ